MVGVGGDGVHVLMLVVGGDVAVGMELLVDMLVEGILWECILLKASLSVIDVLLLTGRQTVAGGCINVGWCLLASPD